MTMADIVCTKCKSDNWYEWNTKEIAFAFWFYPFVYFNKWVCGKYD